MYVKNVKLVNFRSYKDFEVILSGKTLIVGKNGAGKSNIVEALYLMGSGKSFRAERDSEMVKQGCQLAVSSCQMGESLELRIEIVEGRKRYLVNGVPRRMVDFVGNLKAVLFSPEDMSLVSGSPAGRRRYLDFVLTQIDREYRRCLVSYEKGLRQRNKLLDMIRDGLATRNQLFFWDRLLIKNGDYISLKRDDYLKGLKSDIYSATYDRSVISESRLQQYEKEEVAAGTTLVGPHRDDFVININNQEVAKYGSRGEQRMAVFWLKLYEKEKLGDKPLLLLDDLFSELDSDHRKKVEELVSGHVREGGQVVMTTTDERLVSGDLGWDIIHL